MELLDLSNLDHQEQEIDEDGLSKITGGLNVLDLITKKQFGKGFTAVLGVGTIETLVPSPGEKPLWKH